jgi:hypothetical protein
MNLFLQHVPTDQRNPNRFVCRNHASYAPFLLNPLFPVALLPVNANLPFRDQNGLRTIPWTDLNSRKHEQLFRAITCRIISIGK